MWIEEAKKCVKYIKRRLFNFERECTSKHEFDAIHLNLFYYYEILHKICVQWNTPNTSCQCKRERMNMIGIVFRVIELSCYEWMSERAIEWMNGWIVGRLSEQAHIVSSADMCCINQITTITAATASTSHLFVFFGNKIRNTHTHLKETQKNISSYNIIKLYINQCAVIENVVSSRQQRPTAEHNTLLNV